MPFSEVKTWMFSSLMREALCALSAPSPEGPPTPHPSCSVTQVVSVTCGRSGRVLPQEVQGGLQGAPPPLMHYSPWE